MKNYDCMQGFLQLIIIFFMQEIGGNIWWFNVSLLNLFKSQNYSDFKVTYMRYLGTSGVSCMLKAKDRSHKDYYYFTTLRMSSSILDKTFVDLLSRLLE